MTKSRSPAPRGRGPKGGDYEVGYGKPPKHSRFKKGLSGNPKGRPPRQPDLLTELARVLGQKVTITVNDSRERVTIQQAILLRLRDQALHGEVWANKLLQKIFSACPENTFAYDEIESQLEGFRRKQSTKLLLEDLGIPAKESDRTEQEDDG